MNPNSRPAAGGATTPPPFPSGPGPDMGVAVEGAGSGSRPGFVGSPGGAGFFLAGHLLRLFNEGRECDVHFLLDDGQIIGAHKLILQSVEFFNIMFRGGFHEAKTKKPIRIQGITAQEMAVAFRFIYTGALETLTHKTALRLLWISQMWQFDILRQATITWALDHLDKASCVQTFVDVSNVLLSIPNSDQLRRVSRTYEATNVHCHSQCPDRSISSSSSSHFPFTPYNTAHGAGNTSAIDSNAGNGTTPYVYAPRFPPRAIVNNSIITARGPPRLGTMAQKGSRKQKTEYGRFLERFKIFLDKLPNRDFHSIMIKQSMKLSELRDCQALEAFAGLVARRAYEEDVEGQPSGSTPSCRENKDGSNTSGKKVEGGEETSMLESLFRAVVRFHRYRDDAEFVRKGLYSLLPRIKTRNSSKASLNNIIGKDNTGDGKIGKPEETKPTSESDAGDVKIGKDSQAAKDYFEDPSHIHVLDISSDFKAGSSPSFLASGDAHARFYVDCQQETRPKYKGWHGIYLCPDWQELSEDGRLPFESLPALVSFKLTLTAGDTTLWEYHSDPIVFLSTDTGWGQCRAVKSDVLRKHRSGVISCYAKSSAIFRLCAAYLYKNFGKVDAEVLSSLDARTFQSLVVPKFPARKGGLAAQRLECLCEKLSSKAEEWASLRSRLQKQESDISTLVKLLEQERRSKQLKINGIGHGGLAPSLNASVVGKLMIEETLANLPDDTVLVVNLRFGKAFVPKRKVAVLGSGNPSHSDSQNEMKSSSNEAKECNVESVAKGAPGGAILPLDL